jgi:hypothetical protein
VHFATKPVKRMVPVAESDKLLRLDEVPVSAIILVANSILLLVKIVEAKSTIATVQCRNRKALGSPIVCVRQKVSPATS